MATCGSWIVTLRNKIVSSLQAILCTEQKKEKNFPASVCPSRGAETGQQRTGAPAPLTIKSIATCRNEPRHCLFKQKRQEMRFWSVTDVMRNG